MTISRKSHSRDDLSRIPLAKIDIPAHIPLCCLLLLLLLLLLARTVLASNNNNKQHNGLQARTRCGLNRIHERGPPIESKRVRNTWQLSPTRSSFDTVFELWRSRSPKNAHIPLCCLLLLVACCLLGRSYGAPLGQALLQNYLRLGPQTETGPGNRKYTRQNRRAVVSGAFF